MRKTLQGLERLLSDYQHARILRLTFPHNDAPLSELLVNKLDASEGLSRDFEFTVELLADNATLELKDLQGKLLCVELVRQDGSLRYFTGHVFSFRFVRTDGDIAFYEARLGPWLKYLSLRTNCMLFHGVGLYEQTRRITGHFDGGSKEECEFLIIDTHHSATNNYHVNNGIAPHYENRFTCIRKLIPWRPGRGFNSVEPKIYGLQTATVVGPKGEEIYTDEYGRVKVQFHWDRDGEFDEGSSAWLRVATAWAGSNFGATFIPRIGCEVSPACASRALTTSSGWKGGIPGCPLILILRTGTLRLRTSKSFLIWMAMKPSHCPT